MVVFTCGHCGESVQKPKVEKHYLTKCRNLNPNLSCMDCFKDFLGNDYQNHTKCITEEQRYSAKGFVAKEKKGEKKQNAWVEMLQSVLDEQKNASGNVLRIIETISKHNNTPRKKPKFINFVKNVCGAKTNLKDIDQAWDLISVKLSGLSNNQNKKKDQKDDIPETNANADEDKNDVNDKEKEQNGDKIENGDNDKEKETVAVETLKDDKKKMSKKQRKEEKKRKKYEAELQSAAIPPTEVQDENVQVIKKDKKKKNKDVANNGKEQEREKDGKNKNKKRKRLDTVNSIHETNNHNNSNEINENIENEPVNKEKNQKKKLKLEENDEIDENICLHDQNVAKSEEITEKNGKFNWHSIIISVLEKKGNELPFKRLQKKVLTAYTEATEQEVDDRIADKFIKKLKSAPNVKVDKNRVLLIQ